jgi:hypothetical protein
MFSMFSTHKLYAGLRFLTLLLSAGIVTFHLCACLNLVLIAVVKNIKTLTDLDY